MTPEEQQYRQQQIQAVLQERASEDFMAFLQAVTIPSATGPQRLRECVVAFQQRWFEDVALSLQAVRDGRMPPCRRFWMERTKKAGKDSDLALCLVWLMAFAVRPLLVQVCAANQKQSGIIKRRAEAILFENPWLRDKVRIVQNKMYGQNKAEVVIEATGTAGSAQGETPDLLVLNEAVHVERWSVMETHMNNADGVPQGVVIISTNAGFKGTPAHVWKLMAEENQDRWNVHNWKGKAPWVSQFDMDEAERRNKGSEFKRLWKGLWVSGRGDAVQEDVIDRCFDNDLQQIVEPEPGWRYVAGLDLGVSHDHAGLAVLGANETEGLVRLAWMRDWSANMKTTEGKLEVDLQDVEDQVYSITKKLGIESVGYDPSQAKLMAQRLGRRGVPVHEMVFTGNNLELMADTFVQALNDGIVSCYDVNGILRRDFGKFDIVEKAWGRRLMATKDEFGHADVGTGFVIALPKAVEILEGLLHLTQEDDVIGWGADKVELTKEELDSMDKGLREIYDMGGNRKSRKRGLDDEW